MTPKECYDEYKHLDVILSNPEWFEESTVGLVVCQIWETIKCAASEEFLRIIRQNDLHAAQEAGIIAPPSR